MRSALLLLALAGSVASAETAGPQRPAAARTSPAQAAIANYHQTYDAAALPAPCQRPANGEVVVCGQDGRGGSPDRLPLPGERGPPATRIATGEAPHMAVGDSPVRNPKGTGLTLTMKPGKTTLTGNGAQ
jgi:hypothetical protein